MELAFGKSASQFIIDVFEDLPKVCGFCHDEITTENLAGVVNNVGFVCNNLSCLIQVGDSQQDHKKEQQ